jgi:hypothetical protein
MNHMLLITAQRCGMSDSSKVAQLVRTASSSNRSVVDTFLETGELDERSFLYQLSQNLMMEWWEPEADWSWLPSLSTLLAAEDARRWQVVPFKCEEFRNPASREIHVASYQPIDEFEISKAVNRWEKTRVRFYLTTRSVVSEGLKALYEVDGLAA